MLQLKQGKSAGDIAHVSSGRGRKYKAGAKSAELTTKIQDQVANDAAASTVTTMAEKFSASKSSESRHVEKAGLKSAKKVTAQRTSNRVAERRKEVCAQLLTWLDAQGRDVDERIFFSDESMFFPGAVVAGAANERIFIPKGWLRRTCQLARYRARRRAASKE